MGQVEAMRQLDQVLVPAHTAIEVLVFMEQVEVNPGAMQAQVPVLTIMEVMGLAAVKIHQELVQLQVHMSKDLMVDTPQVAVKHLRELVRKITLVKRRIVAINVLFINWFY